MSSLTVLFFKSNKVTPVKSIVPLFVVAVFARYLMMWCLTSSSWCFLLYQVLIAWSELKYSTEGSSPLMITWLPRCFRPSLFCLSVYILFMRKKTYSTFAFVNYVTSRISNMCNTFLQSSKMVLLVKIFTYIQVLFWSCFLKYILCDFQPILFSLYLISATWIW